MSAGRPSSICNTGPFRGKPHEQVGTAFSLCVAARAALVVAQHSTQSEACRQRVTPKLLKRQCNLSVGGQPIKGGRSPGRPRKGVGGVIVGGACEGYPRQWLLKGDSSAG